MGSSVVSCFAKELPSRCVTNDDLSKLMDTSDEWISQRTGIKTRFWAEAPLGTSDLATAAATRTLELAGQPQVDAIIAATLSPDFSFPGIGVQVQHKLGLEQIPAYDIRNQCSGYLYGLEMADALVRAGTYERILFVCAEIHSTGLDVSTRGRDLAVLFGDGAGSCLVEAESASRSELKLRVRGTKLHSNGAYVEELWCECPGSAHYPKRITPEMIADGKVFPHMNGKKVFEQAIKSMVETSKSLLTKLGLTSSDVNLFVPHQANLRINSMVGEMLGLTSEQIFNTIERYGNTTAATIPIGMTDAVAVGRIKRGDIVLHAAFGSGFTWGAAVLEAV